ncbi:MAG: hypothetical protein KJ798_02750 [Gammaproteobacteria bacterium]|nr:hypothetical protein [Gammaproteobacteria bacterium]MBU0849696.1 hypothetical protein [Gammaproteobacteria bacterium]MBU1266147.1 hypothetical protein [Gammaproteobacteria bacterium]MBU1779283.1 hypothetical protein [Gammaproteobacteria bacterium]MBU2088183.1 hypothetical protein [Gammaproteobacteria bacterium]
MIPVRRPAMPSTQKPKTVKFAAGSLLEQRDMAMKQMRDSMRAYGKAQFSTKEKAEAFIKRLHSAK